MSVQYKKLGNDGDLEKGMTPFLDDPNSEFAQVPQAQTIAQARYSQQPEDHLLFAIMTTVFCCIPCGIVAIVKSVDVRNKWLVGDIVGANNSSRLAKRYSVCSLVFGTLFICLWFGLCIAVSMYWVSTMKQLGALGSQPGSMDQQELLQQIQQAQLAQMQG